MESLINTLALRESNLYQLGDINKIFSYGLQQDASEFLLRLLGTIIEYPNEFSELFAVHIAIEYKRHPEEVIPEDQVQHVHEFGLVGTVKQESNDAIQLADLNFGIGNEGRADI